MQLADTLPARPVLQSWSSITDSWRYVQEDARDLRIDFLRGMIMLIVVTVHMEYFSVFSFFVWERVGVISSAEGFVFLSGLVMGMVYSRKAAKQGISLAANKMFDRAFQLYRITFVVVGLVALLNLIPMVDAFAVMHWVNPSTGEAFRLYPSENAGFLYWLSSVLLLQSTPHQFQVMGLYVVLILFAPLVLWLAMRGRTGFILALSWLIYIVAIARPDRLTPAQFEYAFPLMNWQLLFVNAVVLGVHKDAVFEYFSGARGRMLFWAAAVIAFCFWLFTMNNPNPALPDWARINMLDQGTFYSIYGEYFSKSKLGIGRIINNAALFVVAMALLSRFWSPIYRLLGWFAIPIGQASLYVFIVHVFLVLLASLTPMHEMKNFWLNTFMHVSALAIIWYMVKKRILFNVIPR